MKNDFEDTKQDKWEPTSKEMDDLELALKDFPQKEIRGRLKSPFDQYLKFLGVIRFGEYVEPICRDVSGHTRLSKINARLEYRQAKRDERFFQKFPEERIALVNSMKSLMASKKV
jgi:hypothetical protein